MKQITIKCFSNGTTATNADFLYFDGENDTTQVTIEYPQEYTSWHKRADILVGFDKTVDLKVGTDETLSFLLGAEHLKKGYLTIQPVSTNGTDVLKWEHVKYSVRTSLNVLESDVSVTPSLAGILQNEIDLINISLAELQDDVDNLSAIDIQYGIGTVEDALQGIAQNLVDLEDNKADKTYVDSQDLALSNRIDLNDTDISNLQNNKVDKVLGKGLSSNDFTDVLKSKLDGIEEGAEVNTVTSVATRTGDIVLTKDDVGLSNVDNTSDVAKPISTATQSALDGKAPLSHTHPISQITDLQTQLNEIANRTPHKYVKNLATRLQSAQQSTNILVVGDSTGNEQHEWVFLLSQYLSEKAPKYSTCYRLWNDLTQRYNSPIAISDSADDGYGLFTSDVGNGLKVNTTSKAALNITNDIEIIAKIAPDLWVLGSGAQTIVNRFGGSGARGFNFSLTASRRLYFWWSNDGTTNILKNSETLPVVEDGQPLWVKVTMDVDNGAGSYELRFFYSTDGNSWTQIGSTITGATTAIFNPNARLMIGIREGSDIFNGKIYKVIIKDGIGIGAKPIASPDFGTAFPSGVPTFTDAEGNIYSNGGGVTYGHGKPSLTIYNGSKSGASIAYTTDETRFALQTPVEMQMSFINYGHNHGTNVDFYATYEGLIDKLLAKYPYMGIACVAQNPQQPPEVNIIPHAIRCNQIIALSARYDYGICNVFKKFLDRGDFSDWMADGCHPNQIGQLEGVLPVIQDYLLGL